MTTPTPRWTAETEELVARAIFAHVHPTGDWGTWSAEPHHDYFGDEARKVLTTLADAGVLTAVGGETRTEWGIADVVDHDEEIWPVESEDRARTRAARLSVKLYRRTITTHKSPWQEVTDDPA